VATGFTVPEPDGAADGPDPLPFPTVAVPPLLVPPVVGVPPEPAVFPPPFKEICVDVAGDGLSRGSVTAVPDAVRGEPDAPPEPSAPDEPEAADEPPAPPPPAPGAAAPGGSVAGAAGCAPGRDEKGPSGTPSTLTAINSP
jgi:hypothetical protein